jgi:hypothetical protein
MPPQSLVISTQAAFRSAESKLFFPDAAGADVREFLTR